MQSDEETKELLRELRDVFIAHSKKYDEHLEDYKRLTEEAKAGSYQQWAFMGVVMFAAVSLARLVVP